MKEKEEGEETTPQGKFYIKRKDLKRISKKDSKLKKFQS